MARSATDFSRFDGNAELIALQKKLPAGITINVNKNGELTYTVKTSETVPILGTRRVTVGTFSTIPAAVKAMLDYKYRGFLTKEYFESMEELQKRANDSVLIQMQRENIAALEAAQKRLLETKHRAISFVENERALGVDAILSSLPPHEIPLSGDLHMNHPTTGEPIVIVAASIAAWFKLQETIANSGESEAHFPSSQTVSESAMSAEDVESQKEQEAESIRAAAFFGNTHDLLIVDDLEDSKE